MELSQKLKELRQSKNVSQEKLAQYLNVSFQAVSKWENGVSMPDITLLPDIARFFSITTDELLCVKSVDESRLYEEYCERALEMHHCGKPKEDILSLWQEAYHKMPNNIDVKEKLITSYYDADRKKYADELIELGIEIYTGNIEEGPGIMPMYYKGQAIRIIANTYAALDKADLALKWAKRAPEIYNSSGIIFFEIDEGDEMLADIAFCMHWFLQEIFYFANSIAQDDKITMPRHKVLEALTSAAVIFEAVYKNDDMDCSSLWKLYTLHRRAARLTAESNGTTDDVKHHLLRALACAVKAIQITPHRYEHALLWHWDMDWNADAGTTDRAAILLELGKELAEKAYDKYRSEDWFTAICGRVQELTA